MNKPLLFLMNILLGISLFAPPGLSGGEKLVIVELKSGGRLEGKLVAEQRDGIVLDTGFGHVAVGGDDIVEVRQVSGEHEGLIRDSYDLHRRQTRENALRRKEKEAAVMERRRGSLNAKAAEERHFIESRENSVKMTGERNMTVHVLLNNELEVPMVVDTGASLLVVPRDVARKLSVDLRTSKRVRATLADGTEKVGIPVKIGIVSVGDAMARNVPAVVIDTAGGQKGLLGMSFLGRFHIRIDSENSELILKKK